MPRHEPPFGEAAATTVEDRVREERDRRLLAALRAGDEAAFASLVAAHHASLHRLARSFGATDAVAEEIVQETWVAALRGLDGFEERSSLRTWLFAILRNQARRRATRERRTLPFSALAQDDDAGDPAVDPRRFRGPGHRWEDHWATPPRPWEDPERRLASVEAREHLRRALDALPDRQRIVVVLRDVEGLAAEEVCALLEISEGNQRVLLHRARGRLRAILEAYVDA
jgi:RNA polymerase sigma-70 factor, ECF subfamily